MKNLFLTLTLLGLCALGARAQNGIVFDLLPPEINDTSYMRVSDDGRRVATNVNVGSSVQGMLWELGSGATPLTAQGGSVTSLSHDGESATIRENGSWSVLEIATGVKTPIANADSIGGVSNDRRSVVGAMSLTNPEATVWIDGAPLALGFLPGETYSYGVDISRTGNTILGSSGQNLRSFVWRQSTGMIEIDRGDNEAVYGLALSADGSTVAGYGWSNTSYGLAFRWTVSGGRQLIAEKLAITASGVNKDGSAIVGVGHKSLTEPWVQVPYFWNATKGYTSLPDYLASNGVDTKGATLAADYGWDSTKISADGTTIVGRAVKNGLSRVYRIRRTGGWQNAL